MDNCQRKIGVSPGRGSYRKAVKAEKIVQETRKLLVQLFNIEDPESVVFTTNVTESLNLVLKVFLKEGGELIWAKYLSA
ncbi:MULTISPECIES: aminotransferase class V-fold PLP-dependent enzyme [unclassified Candidatus Frackibacter]|uniref:aminotransferase class V-fold PLP-dependent enzyme n=1 Tax=unclassified Candidatus Frackibacter TaxID=2648818 RepID=UPI000887CB6A|nr:Aminotransferase class-V [Candidatus Frackibacter sp. WG11]SEM31908.1 Aminotransferase class-V [Candidatus Frackibacter sp. WG12]SFL36816.1 Aminotransferase class-V [Candidatus Frackibacter sp. WG13]